MASQSSAGSTSTALRADVYTYLAAIIDTLTRTFREEDRLLEKYAERSYADTTASIVEANMAGDTRLADIIARYGPAGVVMENEQISSTDEKTHLASVLRLLYTLDDNVAGEGDDFRDLFNELSKRKWFRHINPVLLLTRMRFQRMAK